MSKRAAMIKSGYSIHSANQSTRIFKSESMMSLMDTFDLSLAKKGIALEFYTDLFYKWLNAKKLTPYGETEDYATQMKAFTILENFKQSNAENNGYMKKRSITIEEWLKEGDQKPPVTTTPSNGYIAGSLNGVDKQEIINGEVQEQSALEKKQED